MRLMKFKIEEWASLSSEWPRAVQSEWDQMKGALGKFWKSQINGFSLNFLIVPLSSNLSFKTHEMAFVFRQDRFPAEAPAPPEPVRYYERPPNPIEQSSFLQAKRSPPRLREKAELDNSPCRSIPPQMSYPAQKPQEPLLSPKRTNPTFSTEPRFPEKILPKLPGPGEYEIRKEPFNNGRALLMKETSIAKETQKPLSIPSIPRTEQRHGYSIVANGEEGIKIKLNQARRDEQHTGLKGDSVGPGRYDLNSGFLQKESKSASAGGQWSKSQSQRAYLSNKTFGAPGLYNPDFDYAPKYKKLNLSPAFSSKAMREGSIQLSTLQKLKERIMQFGGDPQGDLEDEAEGEYEYVKVTNLDLKGKM